MKIFVEAFGNLLTREQVRYLISKLEEDKLLEREGGGRSIKYRLNSGFIKEGNLFRQFLEKLSD
ncbi:MAG: hypothetical protein LBR50_03810 [Tannerella sp.]|jgi:hypothetical protein|nr:hypothetical protein [Tannerella sp.]